MEAPTVPLRLAYAGHVAKTQGAEAPVVLCVPGYVHSSLESAYSALTRGSEQIHVFVDHAIHGQDPITTLGQRWKTPEPKRSAYSQARRYAGWITRPPGWEKAKPAGIDPASDDPEAPATAQRPIPPMTKLQAGYLKDLCRRAGVDFDDGLNVAEAHELITALAEGGRIGASTTPAPTSVTARRGRGWACRSSPGTGSPIPRVRAASP